MANSRLQITINEAIPVGGVISFQIASEVVTYNFVLSRSGFGEVTAGGTIVSTVNNIVTAIGIDYPELLTTSYAGSGNLLYVDAVSSTDVFSNGTASGLNVTFRYNNNIQVLVVNGFLGNNYLINNEILLEVLSNITTPYLTVQFNNLTNQEQSGTSKHYLGSQPTIKLNIAPYIKSLFSYPNEGHDYTTSGQLINNVNTVRISINYEGNTTPYVITKSFIRGGKRSNRYNETLSSNQWLTPSEKMPVWNGYPVAGYYLTTVSGTRVIQKKLSGELPSSKVDVRRQKGCNPLYVKFLNQMGGYSYWLFDSFSETESNSNLGSFLRDNDLADLGNTSETKIQATGKVPREYIEIIKDLGVSPEIYLYREGEWMRVLSNSNPVAVDDNKRSYNVKVNFSPAYRFNPSLLWSN